MANYNYIHIHDIFRAIAKLETQECVEIVTTHGDRIRYSKFGNEHVRVEREGFSGCCSDMADVIMASFVRDNMRIKGVKDGKNHWYRYWDLCRVNNPRHPLYLGLYVMEDATEICPKLGFWWDSANVPEGLVYGINDYR